MNLFGWLKRKPGIKVEFKCLACGCVFKQRVEKLYGDLNTLQQKDRGKKKPYSEFVVPARVVCSQCQAVDRYELGHSSYLRLTGLLIKMRMGLYNPEGPVQFVQMGLADGTPMHPFEARDHYAQRVAEQPDRADLRVRYGNVLRFLGYKEETEAQYWAALEIDPGALEALLNLAVICGGRGEEKAALELLQQLVKQAPRSQHPRRKMLVQTARAVLDGEVRVDELTAVTPIVSVSPPRRGSSPKKKRKPRGKGKAK